ncbi:MAG: DUF1428 domain-containing protein [Bacteroidetes bacterium]|nr:DUF1428 domain-containing protein [Bacteroidota bacterium]MBX7047079.1 DUF1428 domain-containing protein [Ignavibacteria bacterium]
MKKPNGYVDVFLLQVPKAKLAAYKKIAHKFGKVMEKLGALEYREFMGDDLSPELFPALMKLKKNEVLISSFVGFKNKKHRDKVNKAMMEDPEMKKMMTMKPLFDMSKMMYGGFKTFIQM